MEGVEEDAEDSGSDDETSLNIGTNTGQATNPSKWRGSDVQLLLKYRF